MDSGVANRRPLHIRHPNASGDGGIPAHSVRIGQAAPAARELAALDRQNAVGERSAE